MVLGPFGVFGPDRHVEAIRSADQCAIADVDREGLVAISGEIRRADTIASPLRGFEAAIAPWAIQERYPRREAPGYRWEVIAAGLWSGPFVLADGSDEIRVEIGDHRTTTGSSADQAEGALGESRRRGQGRISTEEVLALFDTMAMVQSAEPGDETTDRIADFVDRLPGVGSHAGHLGHLWGLLFGGKRLYYETTIDVGDEITIVGRAEAPVSTAPRGPDDLVVRAPEDGGGLVTDDPYESVLADLE